MAASGKITFEGSLGETLAARLDHPAGPARAYALFAHCFSCSKDVLAASRISRELARAGIAVLRFDFTGLGQSEGDFANTNFSSNVEDLVKAADFLRAEYEAPSLLIGHSLGGAAVLAAAPRIAEVRAVATLGAPADAAHVKSQFCEHVEEIERDGEATVSLAGRAFKIRKQFLDDIEGTALDEIIANFRGAILIAHSPTDATVGIDNATRLFRAARHSKSYLSLDGADHLLSRSADALHAARVIAAWAERYAITTPWPAPPKPLPERDGAVVEETGLGKFHGWSVVGPHVMTVDEPEAVGGLDGGPAPFEILSAALAACTTMTLRMYAERKDWALGRIRTEVVHRRDSGASRDEPADIFSRRIFIEGSLDQQQWDKLLEIADKCPVHRTLERGSRIETEPGVSD